MVSHQRVAGYSGGWREPLPARIGLCNELLDTRKFFRETVTVEEATELRTLLFSAGLPVMTAGRTRKGPVLESFWAVALRR